MNRYCLVIVVLYRRVISNYSFDMSPSKAVSSV